MEYWTDEELVRCYAGYSDEQLAQFIADGIPDWQRQQFQRLLRLRRRSFYEDIIGGASRQAPRDPIRNPEPSPPDSNVIKETAPLAGKRPDSGAKPFWEKFFLFDGKPEPKMTSSKTKIALLLVGYGLGIGFLTIQITSGNGNWFTWTVLIAGGCHFLRTLDQLLR